MIIAIDGTAASGKGTLSYMIANRLGLPYLDTGKLYRATAYYMIAHQEKDAELAAKSIGKKELLSPNLQSEEIGKKASEIASMPLVRNVLYDYQRNFPGEKGAVLDGRDIGTVIFPDADIKFFITADIAIRAKRRAMQLNIAVEEVLTDLIARDKRDMERSTAPLKPASDAIIIDNSNMSIDEMLEKALGYIIALEGLDPAQ